MHALFQEADGIWWEQGTRDGTDRMAFRLARQAKLWTRSEPPVQRYVLSEDALLANMGRPEIMRDQLSHILGLLDRHRDFAVKVLRPDVYGNPARGGGFVVFGFGDRGAPVGYVASVFGPMTYYDDESDTVILLRAFERVWNLAMSQRESRDLIRKMAEAR